MIRSVQLVALVVSLSLWTSCNPDPPTPAPRAPLTVEPGSEYRKSRHEGLTPRFVAPGELLAPLNDKLILTSRRTPRQSRAIQPQHTTEQEPNDTFDTAQKCYVPGIIDGFIHLPGQGEDRDHDWYHFEVEGDHPGSLELSLSLVPGVDTAFALYRIGTQGRILLAQVDQHSAPGEERFPNLHLLNGHYYLHVYPVHPEKEKKPRKKKKGDVPATESPYRMELRIAEADRSRELEPNDRPVDAFGIELPVELTGLLNHGTDVDWFILPLTHVSPLSYLTVDLLPAQNESLELGVWTTARESTVTVTAVKGRRMTVPDLAVLPGASAVLFSIRAPEDATPTGGDYRLQIDNHRLDLRLALEPNDAAELAGRLVLDEPVTGWIAWDGDQDWFAIWPVLPHAEESSDDAEVQTAPKEEPPVLHIVLSGAPGLNLILDVVDADGQTLLARHDSGSEGEGELISDLLLSHRVFFLRVSAADGRFAAQNAYTLEGTLVAPPPVDPPPEDHKEPETAPARPVLPDGTDDSSREEGIAP